jgi:hypothetical protein
MSYKNTGKYLSNRSFKTLAEVRGITRIYQLPRHHAELRKRSEVDENVLLPQQDGVRLVQNT